MSCVYKTPLRIGVWFQENHVPFGGPSVVLMGTILGLFQYSDEFNRPIVVLLNSVGDVNWSLGMIQDSESNLAKIQNIMCGPLLLGHSDAEEEDFVSHPVWKQVRNVIFPSAWFRNYMNSAFPYLDPIKAEHRRSVIWAAGVDTDFFSPNATQPEKTQDYFIYFKSQNYDDLQTLQHYLFNHWFGIKGTVVTYYGYDRGMLRNAAQKSKFCIMLDATETQGLAALEILATGCPMFVLDRKVYVGNKKLYEGATSVTCWNQCCGLKSEITRLEIDFPVFIKNLDQYNPRPFVTSYFSYKSSSRLLLELLESTL